jgi:hypothetical protein
MPLNPEVVRQQIANLLHLYPELAEDEELRLDMLEAETDTKALFSQIVSRMIEADTAITGLQAYEKRFKERRARMEHRVEKLRELGFKIMEAADIRKVELPEATLSIRNGVPNVIVTDEVLLPDQYVKIERTPKKSEIKDALKAGKQVPGAELTNGAPSLSIRMG